MGKFYFSVIRASDFLCGCNFFFSPSYFYSYVERLQKHLDPPLSFFYYPKIFIELLLPRNFGFSIYQNRQRSFCSISIPAAEIGTSTKETN